MSPNDSAITRIKQSIAEGKLIAVVGTGISLALTSGKNSALSWKGLVENGFDYGVAKGRISSVQMDAWRAQLQSDDIDDLLSAAEFMGRKLAAPTGDLYMQDG